MKLLKRLLPRLCLVSAALLLAVLNACAPTAAPPASPLPSTAASSPASPVSSIPPPPTSPPPSPSLPTASPLTPTPAAAGSPTPTPSPSVTAPATPPPAEVSFAVNKAAADFPDKISFYVEGSSGVPVKTATLEYTTSKRSLFTELSRIEVPLGKAGGGFSGSYAWEMKKTGSLPPGARVEWQWRIVDEKGRVQTSPRQSLTWEDSRFEWHVQALASMDLWYLDQPPALIADLTAGLESRLARIKLSTAIPPERKPRIFLYGYSEQVRGAVLFAADWAGALAFPGYNIVLTAVSSGNVDWAKDALAHEITHLLVSETVFGPFGDLPTWLNEGLAEYSGGMSASARDALQKAIREGTLISVRSLASRFSADASLAALSYAESNSLVTYLIETWGWDRMKALLAVFKEGSTADNAFKKVYGFDIGGLEKEWRAKIGAG